MTEQPQPAPTAAARDADAARGGATEPDAPLVGIIMGSQSDMDTMAARRRSWRTRGIRSETRVMSAHRDPETVADYCKNARMRGLKVIIAGAGPVRRAAGRRRRAHRPAGHRRPAVVAAFSAAGGLDAILSVVQMPPGVPVAAVGLDNAKNAGAPALRILRRKPGVIAALHPARDRGRLDRRGQAGELAPGRGRLRARRRRARRPADLEAIARATFTVEAVQEREKVTDHDVAAFVDVLQRVGGRGRALDPLRADVLRRARHRARRCSCARRATSCSPARASFRDALVEQAREHVDTVCVGRTHGVHAEPTTFGIKLAGFAFEAERNLERLERAFDQVSVGAVSRRGRDLLRDARRTSSAACWRAWAWRPSRSRRRSSRATATPSCCRRSRWPARGWSASRPRSATCSAPRCARSRSRSAPARRRARARCRTSATRSRRERITGLARVLRGYAQVGVENVALWHERDISHSGAERVVLPDATIAAGLHAGARDARWRAAWSSTPTACARTST